MKNVNGINIEIKTGNASFAPEDDEPSQAECDQARGIEAARILRELAAKLEDQGIDTSTEAVLRDMNGNKVGKLTTT